MERPKRVEFRNADELDDLFDQVNAECLVDQNAKDLETRLYVQHVRIFLELIFSLIHHNYFQKFLMN